MLSRDCSDGGVWLRFTPSGSEQQRFSQVKSRNALAVGTQHNKEPNHRSNAAQNPIDHSTLFIPLKHELCFQRGVVLETNSIRINIELLIRAIQLGDARTCAV